MKKYVALIGAMILVMALTSPALAQDWVKQFKATNTFEIWSVWEKKYDFNTGGTAATTDDNRDLTRSGIAERYRFWLEWGDAKYVRGVVGFEADSTNWGESTWSNGTGGPNDSTSANPGNRMGVGSADQVQLEIKHAYVDFTIPNTPLSLAVGIQGFVYGGRLFQSRDIPGIKLTGNFAPHNIQAFWWRENETDRNTYQVKDVYGIHYALSQKMFNVYAYGAYQNDLRTDYADHPYWIGVGGGFRPGNLNLSGQLVYLGGKQEAAAGDKDYVAFAAEMLAEYKIGPGLSVAAEGYYATGNDAGDTSKIKLYAPPTLSEAYANFGLGRSVFFFMNWSELGGQHNYQSPFGGFWYGRLNGKYSPLPWIELSANYFYIGDTSKGPDGTAGINTPTGARTDKDEDFVGHEINLITKLKIYNNLIYNIGFGYFLPGKVFDQPGKSAENAYGINTGMQLSF